MIVFYFIETKASHYVSNRYYPTRHCFECTDYRWLKVPGKNTFCSISQCYFREEKNDSDGEKYACICQTGRFQ